MCGWMSGQSTVMCNVMGLGDKAKGVHGDGGGGGCPRGVGVR